MNRNNEESWRLILSPPMCGAENMALDEAILETVCAGESPPTLRLYAWAPPCLSLGYAQPIADVDLDRLESFGWDLVRRPTGGRAILHADELTYAIIAKDDNPHLTGGVLRSYRHLSKGLVKALTLLGLDVEIQPEIPLDETDRTNPVCFQIPSAFEITAQMKKLIGSAQVRRRGCVLQHGSLPLAGDIATICEVLRFEDDETRASVSERVRARATTIETLINTQVTWERASQAFIQGFSSALALDLQQGEVTVRERARADELLTDHYRNIDWTHRM
jgi:lipoate-protein ligase A